MQATQPQKSCHALQPQNMDTDDKLVLSPIVFQGMYNFYLIFIFVKSKLSTRTLLQMFCDSHIKIWNFHKYSNGSYLSLTC